MCSHKTRKKERPALFYSALACKKAVFGAKSQSSERGRILSLSSRQAKNMGNADNPCFSRGHYCVYLVKKRRRNVVIARTHQVNVISAFYGISRYVFFGIAGFLQNDGPSSIKSWRTTIQSSPPVNDGSSVMILG